MSFLFGQESGHYRAGTGVVRAGAAVDSRRAAEPPEGHTARVLSAGTPAVVRMCTGDVGHHEQQGEGKENTPDPEEGSEDAVEGRGDSGEALVGTAAKLPGAREG